MRSVFICCAHLLAISRAQVDVSGAEIQEGQDATLRCSPRGSGTPESVSWNFIMPDGEQTTIFDYNPNKGKEGITPEHAERWTGKPNSFDITIRNANRFDNGTYMCIAILTQGPRVGNADLTVLVPPSPPRITEPSDGKLIANKAGKLKCKSDDGIPTPEYTWYKNGLMLPTNSAELPERFPNSSFTVQKDELTNDKVIIFTTVSEEDAGSYHCVATNKASPDGVQGEMVEISVDEGSVSVASVVGIVFGVIFGIAFICVVGFLAFKKFAGDDDDDERYDGDEDGANDVMIGN